MSLFWVLIIIAIVFTFALYHDIHARRVLKGSAETRYRPDQFFLYGVIFFAPFVILFYKDAFWQNLPQLIPLYVYIFLLLDIAEKKNGYSYGMGETCLGVFVQTLLTIIIYYLIIFFQSDNVVDALWPYIVFAGLLILYAIVSFMEWYKKKPSEYSTVILFFSVFISPILPLFTSQYWWSLLGSSITLMIATLYTTRRMEDVGGDRGCAQGFAIIAQVLTCIVSIVLHTILF